MAIFCSLKIYLKMDSNKVTKVKEAHVTFPAAKFKKSLCTSRLHDGDTFT